MATQQIGLAATLDLTNFNAGVARYLAGINQMTQAANQNLGVGFGATTSSATTLMSSLDGIGKGFLAVGAAAATAAAGGLALFASSSVKMATNFEQGLADIAATMGRTLNEITPLADLIKTLAVDPNLKVTLTEAAAASDMLAKSGIHMEQQLNGALRATVLLANATGESFPLSAKVASTAMDAFNVSADKLPQIVDGITGVLNNSRMSLQDYLYVLTNTGGRANQFGIDLGMMNAIMVETRGEFNTGRTQGTAFSEMLRQMTAPTEKGAAVMQRLGINVANADGTFKDIFQVIGEVTQAFKVLSQAEQATAAQEIFGSSGGKMFFALAGQTEENLKNVAVQMNASGQAAQAAATRMDTLAGRVEIFQGILESASLSFGEKFLPLFSAGLDVINNKFSQLVMSFQSAGVAGIANALGMSPDQVAIISQVEKSISSFADTLISNGLGAALADMGINVDYLATSFYALAGAMKGLLIVGIVAAGFAAMVATEAALVALLSPLGQIISLVMVLGAVWNTNMFGIQDSTYKAMSIATSLFDQFTDIVGKVSAKIVDDFNEIKDNLSKSVDAWRMILAPWPGIMANAAKLASTAFAGYISVWPDWMVDVMKSVYNTVVGWMDSAISYFQDSYNSMASYAGMENINLAISAPMFPDTAGLGKSFMDSLTGMFTVPTTTAIPEYLNQIEKAKNATTEAGQAAADSTVGYADMNSGLLDVETGAKRAGKSVENMAKSVEKAREKITDNNLSMANLRGEIAQLESQYPGLTNELINNFNAHIAAGNSVASFGDQLGATERRQMFGYLTKLNDLDLANIQAAGTNQALRDSLALTDDAFRNLYATMQVGIEGAGAASGLPVVGNLVTPEQIAQTQTFGDTINNTVTPAMESMGVTADALSGSQLSGLNSMVSSQLNPALGQLFSVLSSQIEPAMKSVGVASDLLKVSYGLLEEATASLRSVTNNIVDAFSQEREIVKNMIKYYQELLVAKKDLINLGTGAAGNATDAGAGFASGGSFVVPQGYPSHGAGMPIRVHSGELVKIFTASQTRRMASQSKHIQSSSTSTDNSKNITFNLTTNTTQPSKSIVSDFNLMRARAGVF